DRFFHVTSVILMIVAAQLILTGLHELSEAMIIPSGPRLMRLLGPIVRNEVFFFVAILAAAGWLVARELLARRQAALPVTPLNEADQRRQRWRLRQQRRWMTLAALTSLSVALVLTAEYVYARSDQALSPARAVTPLGEFIRIPVSEVRDANLHRFSWTANGITVRFIVIRRPDGSLATALDACRLCGTVGYYQRADHVVCKNCAAVLYTPSIGQSGGCNPIPLPARIEGDTLLISIQKLSALGAPFQH
ncbi:MAG: Fe-S-containing protein, partial [Terriglobia bacterium]